MTVLLLAVGGSLGALSRYGVAGVAQRVTGSTMPVGTAVVNLAGAFLLGLVAGRADPSSAATILVVGFTGGFTTFSTWMVESLRLGILPTPTVRSILNLVVMPVAGILLLAAGYYLTN